MVTSGEMLLEFDFIERPETVADFEKALRDR